MLALAIGCGGSSSKKVTCDGGACGDAGKDGSGDVKKDGGSDGQSDGGLPDGVVTHDTNPVQADTAVLDTAPANVDGLNVIPDTAPVTLDTATPDTRLPDTQLVDAGDVDAQRDTTTVQPDTATVDAGIDAPVNLDAAVDSGVDAPAIDAALDGGDASGDAGDASDAEIDA